MWDLMEIQRQNNQAAIEWMEDGQRTELAEAPLPEAWALSILGDKLRIGPPLLGELISRFTETSTIDEFMRLINEFLPQHKADILSQRGSRRLYKFAYHFSKEYFPIPKYALDRDMGQFVDRMPVMFLAMSHSAYHELDMRPGYLLLLSLVPYPYEGCQEDEWDGPDETPFGDPIPKQKGKRLIEILYGAKVPLLDKVDRIVGHDLVRLIPDAGWSPEVLHQITDGTEYEGVGHFADWAFSQTGCTILDSNYGDCDYMEGDGEPAFEWTRNNVDRLRSESRRVNLYRGKIDRLVEWLEYDISSRFQELLEFLREHEPPKSKKARKKNVRFPLDPTERWVPLDQKYDDEEEDDDN